MNIELIPLEKLIEEVEKRCDSFVCAYQLPYDKGRQSMYHYGKGTYDESCRLSAVLNNDVLNNWTGELETLQRIHDEGIH